MLSRKTWYILAILFVCSAVLYAQQKTLEYRPEKDPAVVKALRLCNAKDCPTVEIPCPDYGTGPNYFVYKSGLMARFHNKIKEVEFYPVLEKINGPYNNWTKGQLIKVPLPRGEEVASANH